MLQVEAGGLWEAAEDFPTEVTYDDMLTYFLDISAVPSQSLLGVLAKFTEDKEEKEMVTVLANDDVMYEKWREDLKVRTFKEVSEERSNINSCVGVAQ